MADILSQGNKSEGAKELLLADYKYLADSFWKNEEVGEKRVTFLITLVTAVLTALTALATKDLDKTPSSSPPAPFQSDILFLVMLFALFALLVIGLVTLCRIIKRNQVTDGYKRDMDKIRQLFHQFYDDGNVLKGYRPFRSPESLEPKTKKRKFGGLAYTVAALNSLIVTAFVVVIQIKYLIPIQAPQRLVPDHLVTLLTGGLLAFALAFFLNVGLIRWRE